MFQDHNDFHASGLIVGPEATVGLIRDLRHNNPQWKFGGGKKQQTRVNRFSKKLRGETPFETLKREIREEMGLYITRNQTKHITSIDLGSHNKHYFLSHINSFRSLIPLSKEYEEAKVFKLEDLLWLPDFHPNYRKIFLEYMQPLLLEAA